MTLELRDVSVWQGGTLPSGVDGVVAKASEGNGYTDPQWFSYQERLLALSGPSFTPGSYHFARPDLGSSASAEADWYLSRHDARCFAADQPWIFALDAESAGGSATWCYDFMDHVSARIGYDCWFYSYLSWILTRGVQAYNRPLWIAWPNPSAPPNAGWPAVTMHQYGTVAGVDANRFLGSPEQLHVLAGVGAGGFLMSLSADEQREVLNAVREIHPIWGWVTSNGDPLLRDVQSKVAEVHAIWNYVTQQGDPQVKLLQKEIVDLLTKIGQLTTGSGGVVHLDDATKSELDTMTAAVQDIHTHFNSVFK